jgi:intracellular multiplication protein IcmS
MNLTDALCKLANKTNAKFIFHDKPIGYEDVFKETGLLPALAKRADQMCLMCLGYGIGVSFVEEENSLLGVKAQFDDIAPNSLRLLYIYDVVLGMIKAAPVEEQVSLDELMYD